MGPREFPLFVINYTQIKLISAVCRCLPIPFQLHERPPLHRQFAPKFQRQRT